MIKIMCHSFFNRNFITTDVKIPLFIYVTFFLILFFIKISIKKIVLHY